MGETSETQESGLRRSARKRTLADMLVNGNEEAVKEKEEKEEEVQGHGSSLPKSGFPGRQLFRNSHGKILRVVKKPLPPLPATDKGGATAVIGSAVPLDLAAILGDATAPKPTLAGESTPTLAELLSSMSEETAACSNAVEEMNCETDECKATMDELVPLGCDISRIEAKIEKMITMVRGHYGLPLQRLVQRVGPGPSGLPSPTVMMKSANFPPALSKTAAQGPPRASSMPSPSDPKPGVTPMSLVIRKGGPASLRYKIKTVTGSHTANPATGLATRLFPQQPQLMRRTPYLTTQAAPSPPKPLVKKPDPNSIMNSLFSHSASSQLSPQPASPKASSAETAKVSLARALLLFPGAEFTYGDFCEKSPGIVKDLSKTQIQQVLTQLNNLELLYQEDDTQAMTKRSTVWQKETSKGRLKNLKRYGLSVDEYLNTLDEE